MSRLAATRVFVWLASSSRETSWATTHPEGPALQTTRGARPRRCRTVTPSARPAKSQAGYSDAAAVPVAAGPLLQMIVPSESASRTCLSPAML